MISDCIISKYDSPSHSKYPEPAAYREWMGFELIYPIYTGILAGSVLYKPCAGNHSFREFRIVTDMLCLETIISIFSFLKLLYYFCLLSHYVF